jgi:hypothetical protein
MDVYMKYYKTACTNLPEDEHLDVRNLSKTLLLNQNINIKTVHFVGSHHITPPPPPKKKKVGSE